MDGRVFREVGFDEFVGIGFVMRLGRGCWRGVECWDDEDGKLSRRQ